ncbi:MAG: NAD(P)H-dependent oxidoreductase [Bacillota bacterium]|nr:NAD(P)H-dependent oxidoreductase [Bacillota bacterium]
MAKILIIYHSRTGHIRKMAEAVVKGAKGTGAEATLCKVTECNVDDLLKHDAVIVGSPTYYGLVAGPIKDFFDRSVIHHGKLEGKIGGAFASSAILGGGVESTILSILQMMLVHGMIIQGQSKGNHFGAVSIGSPDEKVLDQCLNLGKRIAKLASSLHG